VVTGREFDPSEMGRAEARLAVVKVPDERVERVAEVCGSPKTTQPEVTFVDLMALHRGEEHTSRDDSLTKVAGDADAFALVVQCFGDLDHRGEPLEPGADLEALMLEMTITDLGVVEGRLKRIEAETKAEKDIMNIERGLLERVQAQLEEGGLVRDMDLSDDEARMLRGFNLLTSKPLLVVFNVSDEDLRAQTCTGACKLAEESGLTWIPVSAGLEQELAELDEETRAEFLAEYGLEALARDRFIRAAYELLDVITFFTANDNEARAWTISAGASAREAAGKVHSDMYEGFIRAEVIPFDRLDELGSVAACKEAGCVRLEGKDYEVQDGDILDIRFNR
ncbi:MAG: redox-regulated ATPase YchF, partial [Armatimonadia bacterium]|nr:redox-regulated ATPase YchF [Armatimonadia bacterium]